MELEKMNILNVSSKFAICGLPLRVDTYKTCTFGCAYCFSNNRIVMNRGTINKIGNIKQLEKLLNRVFVEKKINRKSMIDVLLKNNITWHCGGMSDPFQHIENKLHITKDMIDITNKYNISILFSTKSDNLYNANIRSDLHTFQFSVTNVDNNKNIEPYVPEIESRYKLYKELKKDGYRVGIRIQPFIKNITNTDIIDLFNDADYFTIEGLKLIPQNKEQKKYLIEILNIDISDFTQMGLLNMMPEIRIAMYSDFIRKLEYYDIKYSIADNDMHNISSGKCCCGDALISKSTNFNNTAMIYKYGCKYTLSDVQNEMHDYGDCNVNALFTSNRQEGCKTINDFYEKRFYRKSSPFSPRFIFKGGST